MGRALPEKVDVLVLGSGAAGLTAALRLHSLGVTDIALVSEGLKMGTSINTGSDKQTYYKLGIYGAEADSIDLLARDLFAGGAVHGDIAYAEAATSLPGFFNLVNLGVPFPHDEWGEFIGYKTDHDPRRRATSCGPYTSKEMCEALIRAVREKSIPVYEHRVAVSLLKIGNRCTGAVFLNREDKDPFFETIYADNVVFAAGGPGGLYQKCVYPTVHTGAIGLALQIGAKARNLPESQFGLASIKFRWNVSGSYMQVLPRFVSVDKNGNEKEFLREYFSSVEEMYDHIFLKGYQWPFAAGHVPGSSLVDIYVWRETEVRGNRVYLDYRTDPADLDLTKLGSETLDYLKRSNAMQSTPLERLRHLNAPAEQLYKKHRIDLAKEMLEIAVCSQHNNGGLAGDFHYASENIEHFYPVGEVNGSHGITRPGGTALNAGQCGAFRASEHISLRRRSDAPLDLKAAKTAAVPVLETLQKRLTIPASGDWKEEREKLQCRMSKAGAFLREKTALQQALSEAKAQYKRLAGAGLKGLSLHQTIETLRNEQLLFASIVYCEAMLKEVLDGIGSRGGAAVLGDTGLAIPALNGQKVVPEDTSFRSKVLETVASPDATVTQTWAACRPLPTPDGWFETVWKEYRQARGEL